MVRFLIALLAMVSMAPAQTTPRVGTPAFFELLEKRVGHSRIIFDYSRSRMIIEPAREGRSNRFSPAGSLSA